MLRSDWCWSVPCRPISTPRHQPAMLRSCRCSAGHCRYLTCSQLFNFLVQALPWLSGRLMRCCQSLLLRMRTRWVLPFVVPLGSLSVDLDHQVANICDSQHEGQRTNHSVTLNLDARPAACPTRLPRCTSG